MTSELPRLDTLAAASPLGAADPDAWRRSRPAESKIPKRIIVEAAALARRAARELERA